MTLDGVFAQTLPFSGLEGEGCTGWVRTEVARPVGGGGWGGEGRDAHSHHGRWGLRRPEHLRLAHLLGHGVNEAHVEVLLCPKS